MHPGVWPVGGVLGKRPEGGWSTAALRGSHGGSFDAPPVRPNLGRARKYTGAAAAPLRASRQNPASAGPQIKTPPGGVIALCVSNVCEVGSGRNGGVHGCCGAHCRRPPVSRRQRECFDDIIGRTAPHRLLVRRLAALPERLGALWVCEEQRAHDVQRRAALRSGDTKREYERRREVRGVGGGVNRRRQSQHIPCARGYHSQRPIHCCGSVQFTEARPTCAHTGAFDTTPRA